MGRPIKMVQEVEDAFQNHLPQEKTLMLVPQCKSIKKTNISLAILNKWVKAIFTHSQELETGDRFLQLAAIPFCSLFLPESIHIVISCSWTDILSYWKKRFKLCINLEILVTVELVKDDFKCSNALTIL